MSDTYDEYKDARNDFRETLERQGWDCEKEMQGGLSCEKKQMSVSIDADFSRSSGPRYG